MKSYTFWKLVQIFGASIFYFWLIETIFFLSLEGWHLEATNQYEIAADFIVYVSVRIWIVLLIVCNNNALTFIDKLKNK